jgi:hypothetical protein
VKKTLFFSGLLALLLTLTIGPAQAATLLSDNFDSYPLGTWAEGSTHGNWTVNFNGGGTVKILNPGGPEGRVLDQQPADVDVTGQPTHASLVTSTQSFGSSIDATFRVKTLAQLRNVNPNPWEVAWVVTDFTDNDHFYYFTCKPNGVELGKRDPAYPGGQRFLYTAASPTCQVGNSWQNLRVVRSGNVIKAYRGTTLVTSFTDNETPYTGGKVGLYNEDARTQVASVTVTG